MIVDPVPARIAPPALALALALVSACGNERAPTPPPAPTASQPSPPASEPPPVAAPTLEMLALEGAGEGDERATLAALGAVPAWEAVVARARYLGRREQSGVVFGRLGGTGAGHGRDYRWLIDETEGAGALAIRLAVDDRLALAEGQRLVAWGAWQVDDAGRWYWQAERVAGLPPREGSRAGSRPASQPPPGPPTGPAAAEEPVHQASMPGLAVAMIPAPPEGAEPVSLRTTPGYILFEVCAVPADPTDGWEIADRSGNKPVARLLLPGDRPSYGAQDYRSPDEHWRLERGVPYVVRVKRFRPARNDELIVMRAVDAPRRIAPASEQGAAPAGDTP